jgi:signal transduction histidine kinase
MNLLLNAAQAMPQGGLITISAKPLPGEKVEFCVTDNGAGIPPDILPHVFEPFFTTKRGKGTGLGLSISQAYVRNHGGEIEVESAPQSGTRVRVVLPLVQQVREAAQSQEVIA